MEEISARRLRRSELTERQGETMGGLGDSRERRVWSVDEAAHLLGISRAHAYELVARCALPHVRLGRRIVIPKRAVEQLLAQSYG
jgi:excisionase family DNA binding protein